MKKIITAINNPKLNEELRKEKNFKIIGKDIQYKEAILEILEKGPNIDLIILSEEILGEIKIENLIEKIKLINEKIKIIYILEKENKKLEKILIKNNIIDIYYNYQINLEELIKIINKKERNMEEEIIKLKKIIESKNREEEKKQKEHLQKFKKKKTKSAKIESKKNQIITFSGNYKSGKTTLSFIISKYLSEKNKRILLIDGDMQKKDLSILLKKDKKEYLNKIKKLKNKGVKKKLKLNNKYKKLVSKKNIIYFYKIKNIVKVSTKKINNNLYFFDKLNRILKNKKDCNLKKRILIFLKLVQQNYDIVIIELSRNNFEKINQEILRNSFINFVLLEPNLLGIREMQKLLKNYFCKWNIAKNNLYIISNRKSINSVNKKLIGNCLLAKNEIFEVRENKFYRNFFNNPILKKQILLKNKIIKKEINKIINKIIIVEK